MSVSSCRQVQLFADGQLAPPDKQRFIEHLAGCGRCARALEEILQLRALGETSAAEPPPPRPEGDEGPRLVGARAAARRSRLEQERTGAPAPTPLAGWRRRRPP